MGGRLLLQIFPGVCARRSPPQKNTPAGWLIVTGFVAYLSFTPSRLNADALNLTHRVAALGFPCLAIGARLCGYVPEWSLQSVSPCFAIRACTTAAGFERVACVSSEEKSALCCRVSHWTAGCSGGFYLGGFS